MELAVVAFVLALVGGFYAYRRYQQSATASPAGRRSKQTAEIMDDLRSRVLDSAPTDQDLSMNYTVWGVVFEFEWKGNPVIVTAYANGVAMVFSTTGVGIWGGSADETWKRTATLLCQKTETVLSGFKKVKGLVGPAPGSVRFHALTMEGISALEVPESSLRDPKNRLAALHELGRRLLTTVLDTAK
jgi:hypothetical protein